MKVTTATPAFYVLLSAAFASTLWLPFDPARQEALMSSRHLRAKSFPEWASLQLVPTMYNFANRTWISAEPLTPARLAAAAPLSETEFNRDPLGALAAGTYTCWMNHYPPRLITFGGLRRRLYRRGEPTYFCFQSRFRGQVVESHYLAVPHSGKLLFRAAAGESPDAGK